MAEPGPTHSPWYWDRFDDLDAHVDDVGYDPGDAPTSPAFEVELEPLIDTYWDGLDER